MNRDKVQFYPSFTLTGLFHSKTFEILKGFHPLPLERTSALVPPACIDPTVGSKVWVWGQRRWWWAARACMAALVDGKLPKSEL